MRASTSSVRLGIGLDHHTFPVPSIVSQHLSVLDFSPWAVNTARASSDWDPHRVGVTNPSAPSDLGQRGQRGDVARARRTAEPHAKRRGA